MLNLIPIGKEFDCEIGQFEEKTKFKKEKQEEVRKATHSFSIHKLNAIHFKLFVFFFHIVTSRREKKKTINVHPVGLHELERVYNVVNVDGPHRISIIIA